MSKITVLGAGMVGRAIARDLAASHSVRSVDRDPEALAPLSGAVATQQADLSDAAAVRTHIADADLVVCAVPGFMGFRTMQTLIDAGKKVVDISFMPEDVLTLDGLAKERGAIVVADMGVAPGMDNLILGHHDATHETIVVSKSLDDRKVPEFVVEYVVFHEMLHVLHPVRRVNGRRRIHTREFKRDERQFAYFGEAGEWINQNIHKLKRRAAR